MRLILSVTTGSTIGRMLACEVGGSLRIGRTDQCDVAFPDDAAMSGVHFQIRNDGATGTIEDLGSRNGTFVNGERLSRPVTLFDGDEVRAGATTFAVRIEAAVRSPAPVAVPVAGPASPRVSYTMETCDSGLVLCRGELDEIRPADLATRLGRSLPAHLVVDFHHLGKAPPEALSVRNPLFDWLDADAAQAASPLVISQDEFADWAALVEQGWGSNAVVCFFSRQEKGSLLSHLRKACYMRSAGTEGLLGWCWPNVLSLLLSQGAATIVQRLMAGIDAVLVEFPDLPQTWQLFGPAALPETLDRLGFTRTDT